ncbi:MAG: cation:proton antiporter, partial [Acidobacteria bacterium]|nr:cation:proton antiporter [Acidobacteriota bacterium]
MTEIALILAAGVLAFALFRWSGMPVIPLLILGGLLLSAVIPRPATEVLQEILLLGLTFLLFSAGTELNPQRVGKHLKAALAVGILQFFLLGGAGLAAAVLLQFNWLAGFYVGLGVAASSTLVVVRLLQQREQFFEPFGRLVLGVLLVQDILVVFLISVLSHSDRGAAGMVLAAAKTLALTGTAVALLRWIAPRLLAAFVLDEETLLLLPLAILFLFVGMAQLLGLPLMLGAFWAGVSLSGFPMRGFIRGTLNSLSNFFVVAFFATLGAVLGLPDLSGLLLSVILVSLVFLLTPPLVTLLAEKAGMSGRAALEAGLLLSQTSEFSIILAVVGLQQGHISDNILEAMTLVTVVTMMLTPFVATDKMT